MIHGFNIVNIERSNIETNALRFPFEQGDRAVASIENLFSRTRKTEMGVYQRTGNLAVRKDFI